MILELINIGIHTVGCGGTHRATRHSLRGLGWSGIEHRVVLEILRQFLAGIETRLELGMSDVACHDDGTVETETCGYRVL